MSGNPPLLPRLPAATRSAANATSRSRHWGSRHMGCEAPICVDANVRSAHVGADRETVVLLHGSASNSALWRHTKNALQSRYRGIAPDLIGYGSSAAWPQPAAFGLDAELRAIEPLLRCCADTLHLVGYSYGGVLALHLALADPDGSSPSR